MKMRKILAIILTIVMAASMLSAGALAAGDPTFRGADIEAKAGETITYDVYIENNPGIAGYMVMVDFSEDAFDVGTKKEDDFENTLEIEMGDFSLGNATFGNLVSNQTAYGCVALWFNVSEIDDDGCIFSVTLKVSDDAINGKHAVKIRYDAINTIDKDYNLVSFKTIDGSVTVSGGVDGTINNDEVGPTEEELEQMEEGTLSAMGTPVEEGESAVQIDTNEQSANEQLDVEGENAEEEGDAPGQSSEADGEGMNIMQLILIIAAIVVAIVVAVLVAVKAKAKKAAAAIGVIPGDGDREMEIEEVMGWNDADDDEDDED